MATKLERSFAELIERKKAKMAAKKMIKMKDIGRKAHHFFECEAFAYLQQHNSPEKYFMFERLRRIKVEGKKANPKLIEEDIEYRISYYIIGKNGNKKGRWTFGQFCPTVPPSDFTRLIEKAKRENVIIN